MAKVILDDVANLLGNPTSAATAINENNTRIENALENTLSRDGTTPNQMQADLDMDNNDILNVNRIDAQNFSIGGSTDLQAMLDEVAAAVVQADLAADESAASSVIAVDAAGEATFQADRAEDAAIQAEAASVFQMVVDSFTGTGAQTDFILSDTPAFATNVFVTINGLTQSTDSYTVVGTTLTFSEAPPNSSQIQVRIVASTRDSVDTLLPSTEAQALAGLNNTTYMTPLRVQQVLDAVVPVVGTSLFINANDYGIDKTGATDVKATIQEMYDDLPASGGVLFFPSGDYLLNAGVSNTPLYVDKPNVTILGEGRGTRFIVGGSQKQLFVVGIFAVEGTRVKGFRARDFLIDGMSINDSSNDYSKLNLRYVDDGIVHGVSCINIGGSAIRIGRGSLDWSLTNQRARRCRVSNCYLENVKELAIELHGAAETVVSNNIILGGSMTDHTSNISIRFVKTYNVVISDNVIQGMGRGICGSTTPGDDQTGITITGNSIISSTAGPAMVAGGPMNFVTVTNNTCVSSGGSQVVSFSGSGSGEELADAIFSGNLIVAGQAVNQSLLYIQDGVRVTVAGNTFRHLGITPIGTTYAIRFDGCAGMCVVNGNTLDIDGSIYGIGDTSGQGSLRLFVVNNVALMGNTSLFTRQVSSSGTLIQVDGGGNANTTLTR